MPFAILGGGSNIYILHAEWGFAKTPKRDYVIYMDDPTLLYYIPEKTVTFQVTAILDRAIFY